MKLAEVGSRFAGACDWKKPLVDIDETRENVNISCIAFHKYNSESIRGGLILRFVHS